MDYEGLFDNAPKEKTTSKEDYAAQKKAQRDALWVTTNEAIAEIFINVDNLCAYLDVCAKFPNYNINNKSLIASAMPFATQLKSYDDWQKEGYQVRKGEKSFSIWIRQGTDEKSYANPYPVFDVTQTDKEDLEPPRKIDIVALLKAFGKNSGSFFDVNYKIINSENYMHIDDDEDITYDAESNTIYSRAVINQEIMLANLCEETIYVVAGKNNGKFTDKESVTAICASYILAKRYGLNVPYDFTGIEELFPKVSETAELKDAVKDIKAQLEEIDKYTDMMHRHITLNLKEMSKER